MAPHLLDMLRRARERVDQDDYTPVPLALHPSMFDEAVREGFLLADDPRFERLEHLPIYTDG